MKPRAPTVLGAIAICACIYAQRCPGAEPLELPTKIVMTDADCQEIREKHTLRGRPVVMRVHINQRGDMWDGIQVFTGRKSDVIDWFESGREGLEGLGSSQDVAQVRNFQYELLCSELLQTGDVDIIRAVLWHANEGGEFAWSEYLCPDWAALVEDQRLTVAERIVAWHRAQGDEKGRNQRDEIESFWATFGGVLEPDHILRLRGPGGGFPWEVSGLDDRTPSMPPPEKLRDLLLPLVRREYLSVRRGHFVESVARTLREQFGGAYPDLIRQFAEDLVSWDSIGDGRSAAMWSGLGPSRDWTDEITARVERLIWSAKVPRNAAVAFWGYSETKAGQASLKEAGGWQKYFERYLEIAFSKNTSEEQFHFLEALIGYRETPYGELKKVYDLDRRLREGNVILTVTKDQHNRLAQAWESMPEALEHMKVAGP